MVVVVVVVMLLFLSYGRHCFASSPGSSLPTDIWDWEPGLGACTCLCIPMYIQHCTCTPGRILIPCCFVVPGPKWEPCRDWRTSSTCIQQRPCVVNRPGAGTPCSLSLVGHDGPDTSAVIMQQNCVKICRPGVAVRAYCRAWHCAE